jgi:hypothetical protein
MQRRRAVRTTPTAADTASVPIPERAQCHACRKWLAIGGLTNSRWRLPDDANLDFLEAQIKTAMRAGDSITVDIVDEEPFTERRLLLNGSALPFVVLIEEREA